MEVINSVETMQNRARQLRDAGLTIGFVPTMGFLHEGHLSLIELATANSDFVVMSIFINPAQFGEGEDYEDYPRDFDRDRKLAQDRGADLIFYPEADELYPENYRTYVTVEELSKKLCGASRPGHFRGVTTIVTKLFNIVQPDIAIFGRKDAQQAIILQRLVRDLHLQVKILTAPIVREEDGLAMSSRNTYLSPEERQQALALNRSLQTVKKMVESGTRDSNIIIEKIRSQWKDKPAISEDYISVVDVQNLEPIAQINQPALIAIAAYVGTTRLIDNIIVNADGTDTL